MIQIVMQGDASEVKEWSRRIEDIIEHESFAHYGFNVRDTLVSYLIDVKL